MTSALPAHVESASLEQVLFESMTSSMPAHDEPADLEQVLFEPLQSYAQFFHMFITEICFSTCLMNRSQVIPFPSRPSISIESEGDLSGDQTSSSYNFPVCNACCILCPY